MTTEPPEVWDEWSDDWSDDRKREWRDRLLELRRRPWREIARDEQLPPAGDWFVWFLVGGRGAGKTRAGAEWLAEQLATGGPGDEWAVVAPTFADARDTNVEGPAGLLAAMGTSRIEVEAGRSYTVAKWNRSMGELVLRSGAMVRIDGADDGALRIQGKNYRGAWCDEVRLWKKGEMAWDESLLPAVRLGNPRIVVTSTPKKVPLVRRLLRGMPAPRGTGAPEADVVSHMAMGDNRENLSPRFLAQMERRYAGTRLGRQELAGQLLEDVEGALFKQEWIDDARASDPPVGGLRRAVVGLDPADGTDTGSEQGIAVVGNALDQKLYVVKALGVRESAFEFCCRGVRLAAAYNAVLVVEKNHGGAFLVEVVRQARKALKLHVPVKVVWASQGKTTRAEPVAALYEQREVRHLGVFDELEEQLTTWTPDQESPDRMDALVWALTELMGYGLPQGGAEGGGGDVQAWGGEVLKESDAVAAWR